LRHVKWVCCTNLRSPHLYVFTSMQAPVTGWVCVPGMGSREDQRINILRFPLASSCRGIRHQHPKKTYHPACCCVRCLFLQGLHPLPAPHVPAGRSGPGAAAVQGLGHQLPQDSPWGGSAVRGIRPLAACGHQHRPKQRRRVTVVIVLPASCFQPYGIWVPALLHASAMVAESLQECLRLCVLCRVVLAEAWVRALCSVYCGRPCVTVCSLCVCMCVCVVPACWLDTICAQLRALC
jgi:hypothetical protein